MTREYACFPRGSEGAKTFATFETNEEESRASIVPAESPAEAARLWGLVKWERLESGGVTDITTFEVFVREGESLRWFDVTIELHPRVLVQEVPLPKDAAPAGAGGAR